MTSAFSTELRRLARLALPIVLVNLGWMGLGVEDVLMVGKLGTEALAGTQLGHVYTFGLMILGQGVMFVMDPAIAQAWGARDSRAVATGIQRGFVLALLMSPLFSVAFWAASPLLSILAEQPTVVPVAHAYAKALIPSLPAFFAFLVLRQALQAMSVVRPIVASIVVANVVNVLLNGGFLYGWFGFAELGPVGAAWATTIGRWIMLGTLVWLAWPNLRGVWQKPEFAVLARLQPYLPLLGHGIQIGLTMAIEVWVFMAVSVLTLRMGTVEMAGHTVALNLASISFMVPLGIGAAASTRVGNAIGRRDVRAAAYSARVALLCGGGVMVVFAIAFWSVPRLWAELYTDDAAVLALAGALLPIAAIFQVFDGTQVVACGVLRGAKDTRAPAIINAIGYWIIGLPVGIALADRYQLGPRGLWWGLTVGLLCCAILLVARVRSHLSARALEGLDVGVDQRG